MREPSASGSVITDKIDAPSHRNAETSEFLANGKAGRTCPALYCCEWWDLQRQSTGTLEGAVAGLVGNEGGVVSEVINLESSGVEAPDRRPRHDEDYHEA